MRKKLNLGLFRWDPSPELNTKNLENLLAFHRLLIQPHRTNGLEVTEFCASAKLLKTVLDRIAAGMEQNSGD
jgi:hypothetical protein